MHKVTVDRQRKLVVVTLEGFFKPDAVEAAATDLHAAIRSLGSDAGQHLTLYDMSRMQVASSDAVTHFQTYFTDPSFAKIWARKVAFVTTSALTTIQMRRVQQVRTNMGVFADRDEAIEWLLAA